MKRSNRKRHRPEEVVAKLRQADEALAKGTPLTAQGVPSVSPESMAGTREKGFRFR